MTLADRIAVLKGGVLQQFASPNDIYNRPASRFVAGFMGSPPMNFAQATVSADGRALVLGDGLTLPAAAGTTAGQTVEAGFRPEHVRFGSQPGPGAVTAKAKVQILEPLGAETLALLAVGGSNLTGRFPPNAGVKPGDEVTVTLSTADMKLFDAKTGQSLAA